MCRVAQVLTAFLEQSDAEFEATQSRMKKKARKSK